mgnify:CR=1 FL=1
MTTSIEVACMESDIRHLQIKGDNDDRLIALLKEQNAQQAREIEDMSTECAEKVRRLSQERDEAVRKATEVGGILNQTADAIMSGLRKMKGDETPPQIERKNLTQISKIDRAEDDDEQTLREVLFRLPKNEFAS